MELTLKGLLIGYLLSAFAAVALIWSNLGAPDSGRNVGILVTTIIPVLIATAGAIKTESISETYSFFLMFDTQRGQLTTGNPISPYFSRYLDMLINVDEVPNQLTSTHPFSDFMTDGRKGINLIEYGIMTSMIRRYSSSWNVVVSSRRDATGTSVSWGTGPDTKPGSAISVKQIKEILSDNPFGAIIQGFAGDTLVLPPNAKLEVIRPAKNVNIIHIHSAKIDSKISIASANGSVLQQGILGILDADPKEMNRYIGFTYQVSLETKIPWRVLSLKERAQYRAWHNNTAALLAQYDWSLIAKDGEQEINRRVSAKILGLKDHHRRK